MSLMLAGCEGEVASSTNTTNAVPNTNAVPVVNDDPKGEFLKSETGTEIATPKPGKANIQGKVFFNLSPVEGIEVKLCAVPNTFADCIGEKHIAKTDATGQYLFADLEPKIYGGLFVRIFDTKNYVFTGKYGFLSLKIKTEADKTFFVPLTSLFKADLKVLDPKPNAKADAQNFEIKWDTYPDAAYYLIELMEFGKSGVYHLRSERSMASNYKVEKLLPNGRYRLRIEAYNSSRIKIAQAGNGVEFSMTNGLPVNANLPGS